jgi:hypothetical protein
MRLLFSCLDITNIVATFEALLMGQQLLFLSKSAALLSYAAESLLSLLWPFSWPFTYIPVFNNSLPIDFLSCTLAHRKKKTLLTLWLVY